MWWRPWYTSWDLPWYIMLSADPIFVCCLSRILKGLMGTASMRPPYLGSSPWESVLQRYPRCIKYVDLGLGGGYSNLRPGVEVVSPSS
jgi:hypothetical protein